MEIWKTIEGYNGYYEVSNQGRVRSIDRYVTRKDGYKYFLKGRILKQLTSKTGYKYLNLHPDSTHQNHVYVHRLVAQAFIENTSDLPEVNHKDEDKANNAVENLEWCSGKYNCNYGTHKMHLRRLRNREGSSRAVLLLSPNAFCIFKSVNEAARFTGYSATTICEYCNSEDIKNGVAYKYLDDFEFLNERFFGMKEDN